MKIFFFRSELKGYVSDAFFVSLFLKHRLSQTESAIYFYFIIIFFFFLLFICYLIQTRPFSEYFMVTEAVVKCVC